MQHYLSSQICRGANARVRISGVRSAVSRAVFPVSVSRTVSRAVSSVAPGLATLCLAFVRGYIGRNHRRLRLR